MTTKELNEHSRVFVKMGVPLSDIFKASREHRDQMEKAWNALPDERKADVLRAVGLEYAPRR